MSDRATAQIGAVPRTARETVGDAPDSDPEVLIIGAGPVGLFAAILLCDKGIRVEIVDQEERPAARSYALALHPATLRLLAEVGIAANLLERAHRVDTLSFWSGRERHAALDLSSSSSSSADFPGVAVLPQQLLENALESRLTQAGGRVLWNHRVSELHLGGSVAFAAVDRVEKVERSEGARVAVAESFILRPELVLGADGHRSIVRKALRDSWVEMSPPELFAVFEVSVDGDPGNEARVVLENGQAGAFWPLGRHRARWSFQIDEWEGFEEPRYKSRRFPQVADEPFPYLVHDRLRELIAERAPWFDLPLGEIIWSMAVRFEHRLAGRFGAGNAWLAGDAAHLASPIGSQSMNLGLREAWELARDFDWILREDYPLTLLERYNTERRHEWRRLLGALGRPHTGPATPPWVRQNAARLVPCIPAAGDDLDHLLRQIGLDLAPG